MKKILLAAIAASSLFATSASAGFVLSGGAAGSIDGVGGTPPNDILADLGIVTETGEFSANVSLSNDSKLRIRFMGFEATNKNSFIYDGSTLFDTENYASNTVVPSDFGYAGLADRDLLPYVDVMASAGTLSFSFLSVYPDLSSKSVANGSNVGPAVLLGPDSYAANFFSVLSPDGNHVVLFFDDGAGDPLHDNHDDLVIFISAIPLPAAMLPMLTGLGGLVLVRRRRKSKAA